MAAQHFLTEAEVLAWLLQPEHDRGNTSIKEPPLMKRAGVILNMPAGKGLLDPQLTNEGAVARCTGASPAPLLACQETCTLGKDSPFPCAGSEKGAVYQLSVGFTDDDENSVACFCTCPFASGPVRGLPVAACLSTP